jgi:HisJ family histidinol phosphate phosphatase
MNDRRIAAIPDVHGHAKGEHRPYAEERPIAYSARMLFLWFYHACRRGYPRFLMVSDHVNFLTFEDPGAVNTLRRALKLAEAGDLYGAAETAGVDVAHAAIVSEGLRRGMRFSIGAEVDSDPRSRPDAQNIVDAMRPDGMIRSVHFLTINHPEKGADWPWPFDNEEFVALFDAVGTARVWEMYVAKLLEEVEKLPGQIVGHLYVPAVFGHWPESKKLDEYENRVIEACKRRGMAIEFNTRFLYREHSEDQKKRYLDAYRRLLRKAKSKGVPIAIGSDAHSPRDQGNAFEIALKVLDDCGINELAFPVDGRIARVALRATRENLESARRRPERPSLPGSSITGFSRAELGLPEESESARALRVGGARAARAAGSKRKAALARVIASKSSASRRSAESAAGSSKAKAAKASKRAVPVKKAPTKKKAAAPKKAAAKKKAAPKRMQRPPQRKVQKRKVAPSRAAKPKKPAAKPAPRKPAPKKSVQAPRKGKTSKSKTTKRRR